MNDSPIELRQSVELSCQQRLSRIESPSVFYRPCFSSTKIHRIGRSLTVYAKSQSVSKYSNTIKQSTQSLHELNSSNHAIQAKSKPFTDGKSIRKYQLSKLASKCQSATQRLQESILSCSNDQEVDSSGIQEQIKSLEMQKQAVIAHYQALIKAKTSESQKKNIQFDISKTEIEAANTQLKEMVEDIATNMTELDSNLGDNDFRYIMDEYWSRVHKAQAQLAKLAWTPQKHLQATAESRKTITFHENSHATAHPTVETTDFTFQKDVKIIKSATSDDNSAATQQVDSSVQKRYSFHYGEEIQVSAF